ncbi:Uncharacterised protein [Flavonifractor plautii]|uniref:Uncharacterized protein n=1 Tax=Flavonifractor plautii TaxID=292800 RepID=A0A174PQY6_FLAPL|nr:Uncharacterised protein [Flavonifractor plautii]
MGEAGGDHRYLCRRRPGHRRAHRIRGGVPGAGGGGGLGYLPGGPHHRGGCDPLLRPRRPGRRPPPDREPEKAGPGPAAVQDGYAPPGERPQRGFLPDGGTAGGRAGPPLLLRDGAAARESGGVLADLHQRRHPRRYPGQPEPLPPVLRGDRGHRAPVLPLHRGQGGALCRQGAAPALCGAHGAEHRRALHPGPVLLPAGGRAGADAPHHSRPGAGRDDPPGLRHRVRLRGSHRAAPHPGAQAGGGTLRGRAVQRLLRLRGGRRPGLRGRGERRPEASEPGAPHSAARPGVHRGAHRRSGDQGHQRALPHDDLPHRVPPAPPAGQRRPAAVPRGARHWPDQRRAVSAGGGQVRRRGPGDQAPGAHRHRGGPPVRPAPPAGEHL